VTAPARPGIPQPDSPDGDHRGQLPPSRCQPPPAQPQRGQTDGLIRLSGRIPAGGDTQSIIMSPGQHRRPADLGKAGCSWPCPPAATAGHPAQKGHQPGPLNPYPAPGGLPVPGRPLPAHGGPRQGRLRRRYAGAARPLPRHRRSHEPAATGNREQTGPRPGPWPPNPIQTVNEHLRTRTDAGKAAPSGVPHFCYTAPAGRFPLGRGGLSAPSWRRRARLTC
jgi:hypothetical protein